MRQPKPEPLPIDEVEVGKLMPELEEALQRLGPKNYAHATAGAFAKGGRFNPQRKRARYAIT